MRRRPHRRDRRKAPRGFVGGPTGILSTIQPTNWAVPGQILGQLALPDLPGMPNSSSWFAGNIATVAQPLPDAISLPSTLVPITQLSVSSLGEIAIQLASPATGPTLISLPPLIPELASKSGIPFGGATFYVDLG